MSRENGATEEKLLEVGMYATSSHYAEHERVALRYADRITLSDEDVDDALFEEVRARFSPEEIVELTCTVAFENFLSKFHRALRVESQEFCHVVVPVTTASNDG